MRCDQEWSVGNNSDITKRFFLCIVGRWCDICLNFFFLREMASLPRPPTTVEGICRDVSLGIFIVGETGEGNR